jgi:PKD domain-containing protein/type IX secretion system substrate protein
MKNNYTFKTILFLFSCFTYGQDCAIQKAVSDDIICEGQTATIVLSSADAGVTYELRDGINVVDSQTPIVSGDLNFTVSPTISTNYTIYDITNSCSYTDLGVVTVNPTPTASATNPAQIRCSGVAMATMIISGAVVGSTFNWTRDNIVDVTGIPNSGSGNISGTLINTTNSSITVTFTIIPSANGCDGNPIYTTVEVKPIPDAFASIPTQTICSGESIASIILSGNVSGTVFNWTRNETVDITGIPASGSGNITGTLINNRTTIQTTVFTITPVANGCNGTPITASITVNPIPVATAALPNQTRCSGVAIGSFSISSNVSGTTYQWTRDNTVNVTGVASTGTGIPAGTPINSTNNPQTVIFTITPSANNCEGLPITVSLLVNPIPNAIANPSSQTICSGDAINSIIISGNVSGTTFAWTRTETVDITGLPSSGSGDIIGSLVNIRTTPQTTVFTITPSSNGCNGTPITASITVNPKPTAATLVTTQTVCSGVAITPINFTQTVTGTTFNWIRDNIVNVTGLTNGTGNISGILTNTSATQQTVNFTITPVANGCPGDPITSSVIVEPISLGGSVTLSQPNVLPVVNITTACHIANGTLYLSGQRGSIVRWEFSTTGGNTWTTIANTANTYNYSNLTQTTIFRAVVQNSPCAIAYSTSTMINVIPNIKPSPVSAFPPIICAGESSILSSQSGFATSSGIATGGTFSNSNPPGWLVGGCGNCLNAGASNTDPGPWQLSATNGGTYSGINYTSSGKFAIANGQFDSQLYTPVFNTFGLTSATLTFNHAYNLLAGAWGRIEISVNGGAYTTLVQYSGPSALGPYNNFPAASINLNAYLGQPNLRIRFNYHGVNASSWAVDNIQIPDVPVNLSTEWIDQSTGLVISNSSNVTVTPLVTTSYAVTSFLNGCNSYGTDGTAYVTVTVNPRPTAVISANQTVCNGGTATFSVAFTGTGPWRLTYTNGTTPTTVNNINTNPYIFNVPNMTVNSTYTVTALNDSKCTANASDLTGSATAAVLNGVPGIWTGLVSTDWFDCKNWAGPFPSATIDAQIPTVSPRMPIINTSGIAIARDLIIESGASVTMLANSNLHIKRDWRNSGSFTPGLGTVTFNGATSGQIQLINSGIKLRESFYNLTLSSTNGARGISVADGFELTVENNLSLSSGDLRLTGEAQLVQNGAAPNPSAGTGKLLKDQQGTKSSMHYNYWSSPVSANNSTYTIAGVLKDGTDSAINPFTPSNISFGDSYDYADGPLSSPIKITNRWIYKYTSLSTSYFSWQHIGSTGSVKVGEGYTMKGTTGTALSTDYQNYVFYGKPNNGDITLNIAVGQSYLVGNPYPSALDANEFIIDHVKNSTLPNGSSSGGRNTKNIFNGAVYFWDHFGGYSHFLADYIGGYACYTLMGGVVAISNDPLINNNNSSGTKVPKRYIPVGQGFFLETSVYNGPAGMNPNLSGIIEGGDVVFKNSQRAFKVESPANSIFFKSANATVSEDIDNRPKIRLSFEAPSGLKRPLLVGADANTTNTFDIGYDAPMIDVNPDDMFWEFNGGKFVIQGVPDFDVNQIIPFGIKVSTAGASKIKIDELENIPGTTEIYLFDNVTGISHDIKNQDFITNLPIGEYNNRFSIRFTSETLSSNEVALNNGIMIFTDSHNILNIKNNISDVSVESVHLYNILGQSIAKWDVTNEVQQNIKIPVEHVRSGTYIVKLKTSDGPLSKKVIIR